MRWLRLRCVVLLGGGVALGCMDGPTGTENRLTGAGGVAGASGAGAGRSGELMHCRAPDQSKPSVYFCDAYPCGCSEEFCEGTELEDVLGTLAPALDPTVLPSCNTGTVEVFDVITLPQPVATDDERIYYFSYGTPADHGLASMPKAGGDEVILGSLAEHSGSFLGIAVDATNVYTAGANVLARAKTGGASRQLGLGDAVVVKDGVVYVEYVGNFGRWSDAGIEWLFQTCWTPDFLLNLGTPTNLFELDDQYAYFLSTRLVRVRLDGSDWSYIDDLDVPNGLAVNGGKVYVTDSRTKSLRRIDPDRGESYAIARFAQQPGALAVDDSHLYVQAIAPGENDIMQRFLLRLALDGSEACVLDPEGGYGPPHLDGDYVYWSGARLRRVLK